MSRRGLGRRDARGLSGIPGGSVAPFVALQAFLDALGPSVIAADINPEFVTQDTSHNATDIQDQSGNNNDAVTTSAGVRPRVTNGDYRAGARLAVTGATGRRMQIADANSLDMTAAGMHLYAIFNTTNTASQYLIAKRAAAATTAKYLLFAHVSGTAAQAFFRNAANSAYAQPLLGTAINDGTVRILRGSYDGTANASIKANGIAAVTASTVGFAAASTDVVSLLADNAGASPLQGDFFRGIITQRVLTTAEETELEALFAAAYTTVTSFMSNGTVSPSPVIANTAGWEGGGDMQVSGELVDPNTGEYLLCCTNYVSDPAHTLGFFVYDAGSWVQDAAIGTETTLAAAVLAATGDVVTEFIDWSCWVDASLNVHAAIVGYQDLGGGSNANSKIYHFVNEDFATDRSAFVIHPTNPILVTVGTKDGVWDCGGRVSHPAFCRANDGTLKMAHTGRPTSLPSTYRYEVGFATVDESTFALTYESVPPHFRCAGSATVEAAETSFKQLPDDTWLVTGRRQRSGSSPNTDKRHLSGTSLAALREVALLGRIEQVTWAVGGNMDGCALHYLDESNWCEFFQCTDSSGNTAVGTFSKGNPFV